MAAIALFSLCLGLAWFDFRKARIPNGATLPVLLTGFWLHFPGSPETWLASALLILGWQHRWLGGGDAKLWLALLWMVPVTDTHPALVLAAVWCGTGAFQLAWRAVRRLRILGIRKPGAWRVLPFAAWLVLVS